MADDDEEEFLSGLYENGHWIWDEKIEALQFVSDIPPKQIEVVIAQTKAPTGTIEFKDDVDLIEQVRYRRRYQRKIKPGQPDVITLQDIKDIAIFTAPINILSPMLINMLHTPTTERFLRALILFCSYYLQISDEMSARTLELQTKVRTSECKVLEKEYRDNLSDLRTLVAKEYASMLIGGNDMKKFHHMGANKKRKSLSDKDARLIETLVRMSVQIVWIALGRKAFNQIELETHRLLKTEIFNPVEHSLKTNYISKMSAESRDVLLGHCIKNDKKINTRSPLINEIFCHREMDYRLMGLGIIKCPQMSYRLYFLLLALSGPEENLKDNNVILGIIGMPRALFDTMLHPLPILEEISKSRGSVQGGSPKMSKRSIASVKSATSSTVKKSVIARSLYPDIVIPKVSETEVYYPPSFPEENEKIRPVSEEQRQRWLNRLKKFRQV